MRRPGLWRARMAVGMTTMALAAVIATSAPARAASAEESRLLALTNSLRASVGSPAVTFDESLAAVARQWAAKMTAHGTISHNPNFGTQITGWSKVSENVGMGPDVDTVHRALVASRSHYANLVDAEVSLVGMGVVFANNHVFVVENFKQPRAGAAPAPPPPTTRPPATSSPTTAPRAKAPVTAVAKAPATTVPATTVPAPAPPLAAVAGVPVPSDWLTLAIEVTRGWERATG